jgi:hypothetical protein
VSFGFAKLDSVAKNSMGWNRINFISDLLEGTVTMSYQPIENYGIIGNMRTVAHVGMNGSIAWYCSGLASGRSWQAWINTSTS